MSATSQLNTINAGIRELIDLLDRAKRRAASREDVLRVLDDLETQIDVLLSQMAPERITDERFNAAVKALKELSDKFSGLRESIVFGRYTYAKRQVLEIQEEIRRMYRLLLLIRAGAPTPLIFQVAPQFLREITAPETLTLANPMAAEIYNALVRKGEATIDELAAELKITDETREEFNRAVAHLISTGYAKPSFMPDNRMVLRPGR